MTAAASSGAPSRPLSPFSIFTAFRSDRLPWLALSRSTTSARRLISSLGAAQQVRKRSLGPSSARSIALGIAIAGGLAAYLHVDWYAEQAPTGVKARGMPDSGVRCGGLLWGWSLEPCFMRSPERRPLRSQSHEQFFLDGNYTRDGKPDYEGRMVRR